MKRTVFQHPELRDANDNIIQQGAFGKNTALCTATNDGWIDYVANDLEALYDAQTAAGNAITTGTLTVTGKTTTGTLEASSATVSGQTTTGTLAAGDTTVTGSITTTGLTVTGTTSVPTAHAGNSSKAIANTEYVQGELTNYLPLSGGTLTGDVDITGDLSVSGAIYSSDPASGENSGQVPTTAWVQKLVAEALKTAKNEIYKQAKLDAHPVGSYYWSNDSTSPATLFGGTWEALPPGYTLIAQGSGSDSFGRFTYTAGQKYGERKHQLTTDELPAHTHQERMTTSDGNPNPLVNLGTSGTLSGAVVPQGFNYSRKATDTVNTVSAGGNQPHNNMPPSIACYGWRRTA